MKHVGQINLTPLQYYYQLIAQGHLESHPQQEEVIQYLDQLHKQVIKQTKIPYRYLIKIIKIFNKSLNTIHGLYLWGDVGSGKTFLLDSFYQCLPIPKMRVHFHAFMQNIHNDLTELQGIKNPLNIIAKQIAQKAQVICFDEFFVTNIADAMILAELFKALFKKGICLVASSNIHPDELYKNGLQRECFIPFIDLIKQHNKIINLVVANDFRTKMSRNLENYFFPLNEETRNNLIHFFADLTLQYPVSTDPICIHNRVIKIIKQANGVIWFDFQTICGKPRSSKDFLTISQQYHTIIISEIPQLDNQKNNLIISFIHLIDILYDAGIKIIISAAVATEQLYNKGPLVKNFKRTLSRLLEMQSSEYQALTRASRPDLSRKRER